MTFLMILTGFAGALLCMHGLMMLVYGYYASGSVWGCHYSGRGNKIPAITAIVGGVLLVLGFILLVSSDMFSRDFSSWMTAYFVSFFVGMGLSFGVWIWERNRFFAMNNISTVISHVPFMPDLERYAAQAHHFELFVNAIEFYDETNYPIGRIVFADYRLGDLSPEQFRPAGYGLVQKFHGVFVCSEKSVTKAENVVARSYEFRRK